MTDKENYYTDYGITPVDKDFLKKQELANLYKKPKKESKINTPHTQVLIDGFSQQADLLYLPEDRGYEYALVVVDLGSRLLDAVPLKNKTSKGVVEGFKTIYKRGILKKPQVIEVDPGSEFKGAFKTWAKNNDIVIIYKKVGRHRQQAVVERANQMIGAALHKRMAAQELLTDEYSTEWVDDLPKIVAAINKKKGAYKPKPISDEPVCEGDSCVLLKKGTKVRSKLDDPIELTTGSKLDQKFRSSDIRWYPDIKTVKYVILKPGYPPLYLLSSDKYEDYEPVAYTRDQLQVVPENEKPPPKSVLRKNAKQFLPRKILGKVKKKGKWYYRVQWKGFSKKESTLEPANRLKQDLPKLVKEYEDNH